MNLFQPISIAAACFLALSACASAPPWASAPTAKAPPPAASDSKAQPAAAQDSAYDAAQDAAQDAANTGGTDPYGTVQAGGRQVDQGSTTNAPQQANA